MNKRTFLYFSREESIPCPSGDRFKERFVLCRQNGNLSLKPAGKIDTVEQIASYHDGVTLSKMIERFRRGDSSALNVRSGFYADVSGYADDPQSVINQTRALVAAAESAPADPAPADPAPADPAPADPAPADPAPADPAPAAVSNSVTGGANNA